MNLKKVPLEKNEQASLIEWCQHKKITRDFMISIPNEGKRSITYQMMLKRNGLRKGVSDLFLAYPSNGKHGLWIEMKRKKCSVITDDQLKWIERMVSVGYSAEIAYGFEHAVEIIELYLKG